MVISDSHQRIYGIGLWSEGVNMHSSASRRIADQPLPAAVLRNNHKMFHLAPATQSSQTSAERRPQCTLVAAAEKLV